MQFDIFTLLPEVFPAYLESSILQRARQRGLIDVRIHNIRDYARDRHHTTDDVPYGGGGGMVMKPEPMFEAVEAVLGLSQALPEPENRRHPVRAARPGPPGRDGLRGCFAKTPHSEVQCPIILLTPQGRVFNQLIAQEFAQQPRIALICGRYEGVDERIRQHLVTDEISIGDYVLTGGELPALIVVDAVSRLLPGVLGHPDGALDDSHASGLLEYPQYTRPPEFRGENVPEVLSSGDHARIEKWRREQSLLRTANRRPDLLHKANLSKDDLQFLEAHGFNKEK